MVTEPTTTAALHDLMKRLREELHAWLQDPNRPESADDANLPRTQLTLTAEEELIEEPQLVADETLNGSQVQELIHLLAYGRIRNENRRARQHRIEQMASVLVEARHAGEDAGELVAAAARQAAGQLYLGPIGLTLGRPGSWEASMLRGWANADSRVENPQRVDALAQLLHAMGQARDDGGDVISRALGEAANRLGSMAELVRHSAWAGDLANIGGQYARTGDGWGAGGESPVEQNAHAAMTDPVRTPTAIPPPT